MQQSQFVFEHLHHLRVCNFHTLVNFPFWKIHNFITIRERSLCDVSPMDCALAQHVLCSGACLCAHGTSQCCCCWLESFIVKSSWLWCHSRSILYSMWFKVECWSLQLLLDFLVLSPILPCFASWILGPPFLAPHCSLSQELGSEGASGRGHTFRSRVCIVLIWAVAQMQARLLVVFSQFLEHIFFYLLHAWGKFPELFRAFICW